MIAAISIYLNPDHPDNQHAEALTSILPHVASLPLLLEFLQNSPVQQGLVDVNDKIRYRSALLLTEILVRVLAIANIDIDVHTAHVLVTFFCGRIADYPSLLPSLRALHALVRSPGLVAALDVHIIFRTLFREVPVQTLAQTVRQTFFDLVIEMLSSEAIVAFAQEIGSEVVIGMLASIYGEKDPRCLLRCFTILRLLPDKFSQHIDVKTGLDLFETIACYFPITFVAPVDDPCGITSETLTVGLRDCLVSHPQSLGLVVPFLLEQLDTEALAAARLQALDCIAAIAQKHSLTPLQPILSETARYLFDFCTASSEDSDLQTKALSTITMLCRHVKDVDQWSLFGQDLLGHVSSALDEDMSGLKAVGAVKVAVAMGSSSSAVTAAVLSELLPRLLLQFDAAVVCIQASVDSLVSGQASDGDTSSSSQNCFHYATLLLHCIDTTIDYSEFATNETAAFARDVCSSLEAFLSITPTQSSDSVLDLNKLSAKSILLYSSGLDCWKEFVLRSKHFDLQDGVIARFSAQIVETAVFGSLALVTSEPEAVQHKRDNRKTSAAVRGTAVRAAAAMLSEPRHRSTFATTVHALLQTIIPKLSCATEDLSAAFSVLIELIKSGYGRGDQAVLQLYLPLLGGFLAADHSEYSPIFVDLAVDALATVLKEASPAQRAQLAEGLCNAKDGLSITSLVSFIVQREPLVESLVIKACNAVARLLCMLDEATRVAVIESELLPYLLIAFRAKPLSPSGLSVTQAVVGAIPLGRDILGSSCIQTVVGSLLRLESAESGYVRAAARLLATVINKQPEGKALKDLLNGVVDLLSGPIASADILLWSLHALVMRPGLRYLEPPLQLLWQDVFISHLLNSLASDSSYGFDIASNIGILFLESAETQGEISFESRSLLWKQKAWYKVFSGLNELVPSTEGSNMLLACMNCVVSATSNFRLGDISTLMALTTRALGHAKVHSSTTSGATLVLSALECLRVLLSTDVEAFSEHLSAAVPVLMHFALTDPRLRARLAALECLDAIAAIPYSTLFPIKRAVVKQLSKTLDDPKRSVRHTAARVSNRWISIH